MQSFTFSVILFGVAAISWAQRAVAVYFMVSNGRKRKVELWRNNRKEKGEEKKKN